MVKPELDAQATPQHAKPEASLKISNEKPAAAVEANPASPSVAATELEDTPDPATMRALKSQSMVPSKPASPEVHWTKWVLNDLLYLWWFDRYYVLSQFDLFTNQHKQLKGISEKMMEESYQKNTKQSTTACPGEDGCGSENV